MTLNIRHLIFGAGSTVLQIVVSSVSLLILYKLLLDIIGVGHLGVWSLILAASSFVHLANSGLTGGIVTHIADLEAKGGRASTVRSIQTAVLSMGVFGLVLVVACYPIARQYLMFALTEENQVIAMEILPLGLVAFWIYRITGVNQAGLFGCQLIARRNGLLMMESFTHLILCVMLAGRFGLLGLALCAHRSESTNALCHNLCATPAPVGIADHSFGMGSIAVSPSGARSWKFSTHITAHNTGRPLNQRFFEQLQVP